MDGDHDDDGGAIVRSVASWEEKEKRGVLHPGKKNRVPIPPWRQRPVFRPQRKPRRRERHFHHCIVVVVRSVRSLASEEAEKRGRGKVGVGCGVIHLFPEEAAVQVVADGCGVALRVRGRGKPPVCHGGYPLVKGSW